jgi:hypothetical protein
MTKPEVIGSSNNLHMTQAAFLALLAVIRGLTTLNEPSASQDKPGLAPEHGYGRFVKDFVV